MKKMRLRAKLFLLSLLLGIFLLSVWGVGAALAGDVQEVNELLTRSELAKMLVEKLGLTPFLPEEATFTDVPLDHQASGYIYACVKEGLIRGYPDGTFRPKGAVTRAEFAAIVCKAFTILPYRPETPTYTDVPPDNWAYEFIEALTLKGIAKGYPDGTFHPDDFILRSEAADALNAFPRSCLTVR